MYSYEFVHIYPISFIGSIEIQIWDWGGFSSRIHEFISLGDILKFLDVKD